MQEHTRKTLFRNRESMKKAKGRERERMQMKKKRIFTLQFWKENELVKEREKKNEMKRRK